jgi:hypothetical protein
MLMVAAMLVWHTASAQPAPWAPERLTPGWVFTPSAVFGVLHDSNVTLRAVNEPIQAEVVGLLNPRGEIDFNGRRTHLNLGYSGALEAYQQLSALNRYEQHGRFELRQQMAPHLQLFSQAGYSRVPTTDRLDLGPGILPFIGIGSQHTDVSGGFHWQASQRTRLEGGVSAQAIQFDRTEPSNPDPLTQYLRNGHSISPNLSSMYSVSQHVSVGGSWNYRHAVVDEGQDIFDVHTVTADVSWQAAEYTSIHGGFGASHLSSLSTTTHVVSAAAAPELIATAANRWGPAYHIGIDHREGQVSLSANYERAFIPSIGFGGLNADQRLSGGAHVPFAKGRWIVGGSLSYGRIEPVALLGLDYTFHSLWTNGTVGYQVTPWLRTEGFVNHTHQTSTARGLVDRTRIGIEFVTSKPVRIQ